MKFEEIINKLSDLEIYILNDDIELYHHFASKLSEGSQILDLGTGWGKSALCLALSNPKASVITMDVGTFQVSTGWAKDIEDYKVKMRKQFKKYGAENITLVCGDVLKLPTYENYFDIIHTDIMKAGMVGRWLSSLKSGGIFMARNYISNNIRADDQKAFKEEIDKFCKKWEPILRRGLIQAFKKP